MGDVAHTNRHMEERGHVRHTSYAIGIAGAAIAALSLAAVGYVSSGRGPKIALLLPENKTALSGWAGLDSNQGPTDYESAALTN
jgi:hypothetical protein